MVSPMSNEPTERSPLGRLVLFMICLSLAASCLAGFHYYVVDYPEQYAATHPPANYGQSCIVYPDKASCDWAAFWTGSYCETQDYGDYVIYQICHPK